MKRVEALRVVLDRTRHLPVVATLAATSRELAALEDRPNHLYLLDSMGLAGPVGVGLALALEGSPVERVVVVEGDGSLFMNLGILATIGYMRPANLVLIVLDNGVYASTDDIPTYSEHVDLGAVAAACGVRVRIGADADVFAEALDQALVEPGPHMVHVRTEPGNAPGTPLLLQDVVVLGARFSAWLQEMETRT